MLSLHAISFILLCQTRYAFVFVKTFNAMSFAKAFIFVPKSPYIEQIYSRKAYLVL